MGELTTGLPKGFLFSFKQLKHLPPKGKPQNMVFRRVGSMFNDGLVLVPFCGFGSNLPPF